MSSKKPLRIGTRGSALARWQAEWIAAQLQQQDLDVEIIVIPTSGDNQPGPISTAASPGLFTKEIQTALLHEDIDVAVHSLKDLPTQSTAELTLAAIPVRESPWDVLVSSHSKTLDQLDPGARVGTGVKPSCSASDLISTFSTYVETSIPDCRNSPMGSMIAWSWRKRDCNGWDCKLTSLKSSLPIGCSPRWAKVHWAWKSAVTIVKVGRSWHH